MEIAAAENLIGKQSAPNARAKDLFMNRLNVFATADDVKYIKECANAPVMFLSGGKPMFESAVEAAHRAALKAGLPEIRGYYGIDLRTGEFVSA